ncbi:hypothetical protein [Halosimplex marinum]|uniref:hypothetical protein n=1 Tax=Halosimplex marinum TaxID=3396620 RepID=UPI003F55F0C6
MIGDGVVPVVREEHSDPPDGRVVVGPPPPPTAAPGDVLPAVVRTRSDDSERYICYSAAPEYDGVAETRLSVDTDAVVERELWR